MKRVQEARDLLEAQQPAVSLAAEPESAESPELESQPAPDDPTAENEALAELNRTLKRKLREAVQVANGCHRALEREKVDASESAKKVEQLQWALLLERAAHQRRRDNPTGARLGPTPAEVQARMAEEKEKKAQEEHRRQAQIERDQQRDLSRRAAYESEKERRTKEAKAYWARSRIKTQSEREQQIALHAAATALATAKGRTVSLADYRECLGLPRAVEKLRTLPATSTSLEHCTPSSSGRECP